VAQLKGFRVVGDAWGACEGSGPAANASCGRAGCSGEGRWRGATALEAGFAFFRRGWAPVRARGIRYSATISGSSRPSSSIGT